MQKSLGLGRGVRRAGLSWLSDLGIATLGVCGMRQSKRPRPRTYAVLASYFFTAQVKLGQDRTEHDIPETCAAWAEFPLRPSHAPSVSRPAGNLARRPGACLRMSPELLSALGTDQVKRKTNLARCIPPKYILCFFLLVHFIPLPIVVGRHEQAIKIYGGRGRCRWPLHTGTGSQMLLIRTPDERADRPRRTHGRRGHRRLRPGIITVRLLCTNRNRSRRLPR